MKKLTPGISRPKPKIQKREEAVSALAQAPRNSGRARVPLPASQSYDIAPQSRVITGYNQFARPAGAAGDDWIRRMKGKKQKKGLA